MRLIFSRIIHEESVSAIKQIMIMLSEVLKENIILVKQKRKLGDSLTFEKMKLCTIFMAYQMLCVSS